MLYRIRLYYSTLIRIANDMNSDSRCTFVSLASLKDLTNRYDLDDEVRVWSDYLGTKFHPRTVTIVNEFTHGSSELSFNTFSQGVDLWKTDLFTEEWTDRCRAYAEECDYLQVRIHCPFFFFIHILKHDPYFFH